jgi:hypothetical protein
MLGVIIMGGFTFLIYLIVENLVFERQRGISVNTTPLKAHDYVTQWDEMVTKLQMDSEAKMADFHLFYNQNGDVLKFSYEVVGRDDKDHFIYYYLNYDLAHSKAIVKKQKIDGPWIQYDRSVTGRYFFGRLNEMDLTVMKPNNEDPIRQLRLHVDGSRMTYGMKENKKYRIDQAQIREITDEQLPVKGYWLSVCGMSEDASPDFVSSCDDRIDYILEAPTSDEM